MRIFLLICLMGLAKMGLAQQPIALKAGLTITKNTLVQEGSYLLNASANSEEALIIIEGENIEVDFNHAILLGSIGIKQPDLFTGLAIKIAKGSKNITLKNANIHGYKIAILAEQVQNLQIAYCNLSYNWQQKLLSKFEKEDESDWMYFHHNEKAEWKRYGAAIYLEGVTKANIHHNKVTGGQCALLITNTHFSKIYNNEFTFNSAIGIGLYRSSDNQIYQNQLDFNIRGFQFGKYYRGQDSAAILLFEQSSNNTIAFNSATHSGDGLFLWAGQETMDSGLGGSNDNFIYGNDFSYAATNGVEITFSRNMVMNNRIHDCDHGIWGGYSFDSDLTDNQLANNRIGIAIEHGQNINIAMNQFRANQTGIKIWSRENQPADWIYPTKKNTDSKNYWIAANQFIENKIAYDFMGTDTIVLSGNTKIGANNDLLIKERLANIDSTKESVPFSLSYDPDPRLKTIPAKSIPQTNFPKGRSEIRITPYGPYNFNYPICWLKEIDSVGNYHFELLGPKGNWELTSIKGFRILESGNQGFPSALVAQPLPNQDSSQLTLSFQGADFINQFGKKQAANQAHEFIWKPL